MLKLKNLSLHLGATALLDHIDLQIEAGERVCLLGRNGEGKSTLLRVIAGELPPDSGEIQRQGNVRIAQLPQDVPRDTAGEVFDVVARGLGDIGAVLAKYHHLLREQSEDMQAIGRLQDKIEANDGWSIDSKVSAVLSRLQLDGEMQFSELSGGLKRRVLLAQALVQSPDLLLLDEPTNHLDVESIRWLEEFLLDFNGSLLFITHDRAFLRRLATRIVELDRGQISSWPGDYDNYLRRREERDHAEVLARAQFDKKLAQEEVWIRQGVQARRTRNEGRVRALMELRNQAQQRRNRSGQAELVVQEAERSGKLVAEVKNLSYSWDAQPLVKNYSSMILRGDKIGIVGANGVGKSTLLKLLLGKLQPQDGSVRLGSKLQVAYFDQLRAALNESAPVFENIGDGKAFVEINGAQKHVMSYLQDFLFTPERARTPVKALSGGERSRLLLARLFTQPCNLLVLDEPTNDLDLETLDLLEERLLEFQGTVLLVSHDREFLNRVATRCIVMHGNGRISEHVGGYDEAVAERGAVAPSAASKKPESAPPKAATAAQKKPSASKLSFKLQRELQALPAQIEKLEVEQASLAAKLSDGALYSSDPQQAQGLQSELAVVTERLEAAYARWAELEES